MSVVGAYHGQISIILDIAGGSILNHTKLWVAVGILDKTDVSEQLCRQVL